MPGLRELQTQISANLFDPNDRRAAGLVRTAGLSGERRLRVYRNNVYSSLRDALQAVYPVVARLVGPDFFHWVTHGFITQVPSRSGNLHDFGAGFADFLAGITEAEQLPYLADVARLEWCYHRVFHAADHDPLDPARLAPVATERYSDLRFIPHPATALLRSAYPVLRIWQVNQDGHTGDQTVDISEGGIRLLVLRREGEIEFHPLGPAEFEFISRLHASDPLGAATAAALAADPDFDLNRFLSHCVRYRIVVDFSV